MRLEIKSGTYSNKGSTFSLRISSVFINCESIGLNSDVTGAIFCKSYKFWETLSGGLKVTVWIGSLEILNIGVFATYVSTSFLSDRI